MKYVELSISFSDSDKHRLSIRRIARIHKLCPFQWLVKFRKGQNVAPNIHQYFSNLSNFLMTTIRHSAWQYLAIPKNYNLRVGVAVIDKKIKETLSLCN